MGHSYVKYLQRLPERQATLTLDCGEEASRELQFSAHPGKDYPHFLNNPEILEALGNQNIDVVVTILGGNSIVDSVTNTDINLRASEYYKWLRQIVGPSCLSLAAQIEPRFCSKGNKFGTPQPVEYNRWRQVLNNFLNKTLKKQKLVDNVILLGAANYLNHPKYFVDGVHLKLDF